MDEKNIEHELLGHLSAIRRSRLFEGIENVQLFAALKCLNARLREYKKGAIIFAEGDRADFFAVVASGEVETVKTDFFGNQNIVSRIFGGELVAAVASYSHDKLLPFDVRAAFDTTLLCLDNSRLVSTCRQACAFHSKIIANMLGIMADKNAQLAAKIDILTKRTTREKILAYLMSKSVRNELEKEKRIFIDLNRQQMADFLSVDRSALSRELSKMQEEGIIKYHANHFYIK